MKKEILERRWVEPKFRVRLLKVVSVILSFFSVNLFFGHGLEAESRGRKIQNYVKKESVLQARKKKGRTFAKTEKGRKIRYYIKKRSFLQSNRGKMKARLKDIKDSGVYSGNLFSTQKATEWQKNAASFKKLNKLQKLVKAISKKIGD